ncbi:MAG: VWA-like domain-containing protein [Nitrospirota bacterium]|nr:VWA-like domain-containing protein [Nitrospirota bacterium]
MSVTRSIDLHAHEHQRFSLVKMRLVCDLPFWGSLLLQTRVQVDPLLPCYGATDCGDSIWYNPTRTSGLTNRQLAFLILHLLSHIALLHGDTRRGTRAPRRWHQAADHVTNLLVRDIQSEKRHYAGPRLTEPLPGLLMDDQFRGLAVEEVYDRLPPSSVTATHDEDTLDLHYPMSSDPDTDARIKHKLLKAYGHWMANGQRGELPDGVLRIITDLRAGSVPWERIIRQIGCRYLSHDDFTYAPPHRRRLLRDDVIAPSYRGDRCGNLAIAIDTSGSISSEDLTRVLSEIRRLSDLAEDILILSHDAAIHDVIPTTQLEAFFSSLNTGTGGLHGNGGTSHVPVFTWLADHHHRPDLLICCTDLATEFPTHLPTYPVLWAVFPDHAHITPPFGQTLIIPAQKDVSHGI